MDKWHKYEILESLIGKVGHQYTFANGGEHSTVRFVDVRGAWAWATDTSPFYCVILGQDFFDTKLYFDKSASFNIIFEGIDKGLDLERRFNDLADIASLYKVDFYADLSPLHEPESDSWYDFQTAKRLVHGELEEAPWADSLRLGIELCKTAVRAHRLTLDKDTEVFNQLARITESDLAQKDAKSKYYAVEALRHVMASFKRDPAIMPDLDIASHRSAGDQRWMQ